MLLDIANNFSLKEFFKTDVKIGAYDDNNLSHFFRFKVVW
jgi:hypothetical protein